MKKILLPAIVFASSILFAGADVIAKSHEEVGKHSAALLTEMTNGLAKITDKASAEAFVATMPAIKAKMKAIVQAAQALPAPTKEQKTAVNKIMEDAETLAAPTMMNAMKAISESPEAEAISKTLTPAMSDPEINEMGNSLDVIYSQDDEEETEPAQPIE